MVIWFYFTSAKYFWSTLFAKVIRFLHFKQIFFCAGHGLLSLKYPHRDQIVFTLNFPNGVFNELVASCWQLLFRCVCRFLMSSTLWGLRCKFLSNWLFITISMLFSETSTDLHCFTVFYKETSSKRRRSLADVEFTTIINWEQKLCLLGLQNHKVKCWIWYQ